MLRRAEITDLDGLMALEGRCFGENEGIFNRRQLRYLLRSPRAVWFIEGDFEGAVCVLLAGNGHKRWGRLYSLSVDPRFRQRGIARRLLEAAFTWLRHQGVTVCRAEVKIDNAGARRLYAVIGFQEGVALPHYYGLGQTGLKLSKTL